MNNKNITISLGILAAFVLAFVVTALPTAAHAGYGSYGNTYYYVSAPINPYGTAVGNRYSYNNPPQTYPVYSAPQPTYYPPQQPTYYPPQQPVYYPPQQPTYYPTYNNLTVSCTASITSVPTGTNVTWTAYASGGNGSYNYTWSGTDSLIGYSQTAYMSYYNTGAKSAWVTVSSNNQTITQVCNSTVNVYSNNYYGSNNYNNSSYYGTSYYPQTIAYAYQNSLDIGCYTDPTTAHINQPVTWNVEVTGGVGPYTYSWTGTDGLTGSNSSLIKYYSTAGTKSAIVTINSADGKSASRACSNTLSVTSGYVAPHHVAVPVSTVATTSAATTTVTNSVSTAAVFSLANVPWAWVALLVILILFATVLYLLFNKQKI